jgi:hypothetical protein
VLIEYRPKKNRIEVMRKNKEAKAIDVYYCKISFRTSYCLLFITENVVLTEHRQTKEPGLR